MRHIKKVIIHLFIYLHYQILYLQIKIKKTNMKKVLLFAFLGIIFSCTNQSNEKATNGSKEQNTTEVENPNFGLKNFAVVWKWGSSYSQNMSDNISTISEELMTLWKNGKIENAYLNNETDEKLDDYPNLSFIIKAKTKKEAKGMLDALVIVKEGIASYQIFPVGVKWMGRKTEEINKKEDLITFVAVWTTNENQEPTVEAKTAQSDAILKLWNEGTIENIYFDIQGTQNKNATTDFVFYINVMSEEEAAEICDNLPFAVQNFASYQLYHVGSFWFGEYNQ